MQQAIYNSINRDGISIQASKTNKTATTRRATLIQRIAHRWDMVGVLALMGSSAAYGVYALAHVGL